ncbi:nuclear factor of activated T-cells 5-like isoform X2 [Saccostrea echinata]|uniref:nuclear factor of activated T-cells 5-like isoform X2 n=1 Tax=Saccostrea echinata TaxID=191078 RepID=UPI002A81B275|nr:nuclear factor of activated T-cells 5-like isoform X2 [Saccostrea echinata]
MDLPGNQSNLLNGLQGTSSGVLVTGTSTLNGIVTSNMEGVSAPSSLGLTAIQVSGTNGIILISQPINSSPTAPSTLTFALPVSNPAQDVKFSPEKLDGMNKLKALLTATPLKVASPVSSSGNAGNMFRIPGVSSPIHSLSINTAVVQPTLTQVSSPCTVSSLGSSDVFLSSSSNYGEVRTSSDIFLNDHGNSNRTLTVQMDNVDSTTSDPVLFQQNPHNSQSFMNYNGITSKDESSQDKGSVLHNLLTSGVDSSMIDSPTSNCSQLSPEIRSSMSSPVSLFETNTQSTLIAKSEQLRIEHSDDVKVEDFAWDTVDHEPNKSLKTHRNSNAGTSIADTEPDSLFDGGSASACTTEFTFTKFGADVSPVFTFSGEKDDTDCTSSVSIISSLRPDFEADEMNVPEITHIQLSPKVGTNHVTRSRHRLRELSLNQQFPCRVPGYELQIVDQPEEQHRARYLTEGSRGAVKNKAGDGHAMVKLIGKVESAVLWVFVGNDSGRVKPHGFYQACKVCGKNSTPCRERDIEGTTVIEMNMKAVDDMSVSVDNVGILKLRNADVEQRIGLAKAKKKSTKARLIFRVMFQKADGNMQTLQISSNSILCTQPIGQPEICKISCRESPVEGGGEIFIIGKNFMKGTKVFFQEREDDDEEGEITWQKEADIDKDYFQQTHLVCTIPPYHNLELIKSKKVQLVVHCAGKASDPTQFTYTQVVQQTPTTPRKQHETPMETDTFQKRRVSFTVSPEALELNNQIQQTQQQTENGSGMFQLPPGTLNIDMKMQVDASPMNTQQNMDTKENLVQSQMMQHSGNMASPISMGDLNPQVINTPVSMMSTPVSLESAIFQQVVVTKQEGIDSILQQGNQVLHQQVPSPMIQGTTPTMQQQGPHGIPDHVRNGNQQQGFGLSMNNLVSQGNISVSQIDMDKILNAGLNSNVKLGGLNTNTQDINSSHLSGTMATSAQPSRQLSRQNSNNSLTSNGSNSYSSQTNILDVSHDFANILQDAKKDHPENIDKMAEAILNEKWNQHEIHEQPHTPAPETAPQFSQNNYQASSSIAQLLATHLASIQSNRVSSPANFQTTTSFQTHNSYIQSGQQSFNPSQGIGLTGITNSGVNTSITQTLLRNMNVPLHTITSMTAESTPEMKVQMANPQPQLINSSSIPTQNINVQQPQLQQQQQQNVPQIIICNPPPAAAAQPLGQPQHSSANNFVPNPAPAQPPSIVILGGQGNNPSSQVENILRSILDSLRPQGGST